MTARALYELAPVSEVILHDRPGWITVKMTAQHADARVRGHAHSFDHWMTNEGPGPVLVTADGKLSVVKAGDRLLIKAHVQHALTFLERGTVARCDHEIRKANGALDPEAFSPDGLPLEWVRRLTEDAARAA